MSHKYVVPYVPHDTSEPGLKHQLPLDVQEPLACVQTPPSQCFEGRGRLYTG